MKRFSMKDYGFISNCKTSYINESGVKVKFQWYSTWSGMIHRCYNVKHKDYKYYGGKGVYVDEYLKLSSNFREFYNLKNPTGSLSMDKDDFKKKVYSVDSIKFVSVSENSKEAHTRRDYSKISGVNSKNSKPVEYWSTTSVARATFKITCVKMGWNFNDFDEVYNGDRNKNNRKFLYIKKT